MKTKLLELILALAAVSGTAAPTETNQAAISLQYSGDGLAVAPSPVGAQLRYVFQRLDAQVTTEGLWLVSTVDGAKGQPFRVMACAVGRVVLAGSPCQGDRSAGPALPATVLPLTGKVAAARQMAQFIRPGLTEEYSVSMDGVRQDFVIDQRPVGAGPVRLELELDGARAEATGDGARLVLTAGGRKLAYNRLKAVDARGREMKALLEVVSASRLVVVLDDAAAEYPVRIDPTFSDANWISLGRISVYLGEDRNVFATAVDGAGNLYLGGYFTAVGLVAANSVAEWNGSSWSALGSGMNSDVLALVVKGTNLYAGGYFTTAGGVAANCVARWNGSSWSALGSGISGAGSDGYGPAVYALAASGTNLYVGGDFTMAGGVAATNIAQWNGSSWSPLGSGISGASVYGGGPDVYALAASGTNLYVGGDFSVAGGVPATNITRWNGSAWSPLQFGPFNGVDGDVFALAVSGNTLFAGGEFDQAGGNSASHIAQWNGLQWLSVGSGVNVYVSALAVSGTNLYAGGNFTTAGGVSANCIALWNGSVWSPLGSGISGAGDDGNGPTVSALAVSPNNNLFVGGDFTTAGTDASAYLAEALLSQSSYNLALTRPGVGTNVITGLGTPNYAYALDLATNLAPPINWMPQTTNMQLGVNLVFTNLSASPQGFYRTRYVSQ